MVQSTQNKFLLVVGANGEMVEKSLTESNKPKTVKVTKTTTQTVRVNKPKTEAKVVSKTVSQIKPTKKSKALFFTGAFAIFIGGLFPFVSFNVAHYQTKTVSSEDTKFWVLWLIVGCLQLASAPNVAKYMQRFWDKTKSWCFVLGCEVAMTFTEGGTSYICLTVMVLINAISLYQSMISYQKQVILNKQLAK